MTPEELRDQVRSNLQGRLPRRGEASRSTVLGAGSNELDAGRRYLALLAEHCYATPTWPVGSGGLDLDGPAAEAVREALADFEAPDLYPFLVGVDLIGPTILTHGSDEQKARWLDGIRSGAEIWCQLFSEPDAGSDLANVKARAVRDGDMWVLDGQKVWTSRGAYSDRGLLLARSDGSVPKHQGISAFGLDMRSPGVTVRPLVQMNGDAHFSEVFFDEVRIPDADRIGAPGDGWKVAITCLSFERGALAGGLGVSTNRLRALARTGTVAGDPVRTDRLVRDWSALRLLEWGGQRSAARRRAGARPGAEGSLAKLATNAMIKDLAGLGLEAHGPAATVVPGDDGVGGVPGDDGVGEWQTMWGVSPSLSIRGGTDEIQRNIIGERVLGLPTEARVDKDRPFDRRPDR